jgi:hypothetical protein
MTALAVQSFDKRPTPRSNRLARVWRLTPAGLAVAKEAGE